MKKILILSSFIMFIQSVNCQNLKKTFFVNGISSLSDLLYKEIETVLAKDNYDSLCIESCSFIRFTIIKKNVTDIRASSFTPPVLISTISNALNKTNGFWLDRDSTVYLLPVTYIFENGCRPAIKSTRNVLRMLIELSENPDKQTFPGSATEKPLKCTILNPLLIKQG